MLVISRNATDVNDIIDRNASRRSFVRRRPQTSRSRHCNWEETQLARRQGGQKRMVQDEGIVHRSQEADWADYSLIKSPAVCKVTHGL